MNYEVELILKNNFIDNDDKKIIKNYFKADYKEIKRLRKELEFERQIKKEAIDYIKNIPDDEFLESEHFTELIFILGKVEGNK